MPVPTALPPRRAIAAYLLAGGASRRMGQSKARLELDGEPLAVRLARAWSPWVERVVLVAKPGQGFEDLGLPLLFDATPEHALVHGLRTALEAPGPPWRLLCACDMPGVGPEVLGWLWQAAEEQGAPGSYLQRDDRDEPEPLPSLWRATPTRRIGADWGLVARDWLQRAGLVPCRVGTAPAVLANLNTPAEWERYRAGREERA